jgi:CBS domain-containing protein
MKAKDVMKTDVVTVKTGATLGEVAALFQEKGINGAPVVDDAGKVVGIVSEHDMIRKSRELRIIGLVDTLGWVSPHTSAEKIAKFAQGLCSVRDLTVDEVMTRNVISVSEETSLEDVAKIMARRRINRVPVMKQGQLLGLITRTDLVWAMVNLCEVNPGIFDREV